MNDRQLPEVTADSEEGFVDLRFALVRLAAVNGELQVVAQGVHRGAVLGFGARLLAQWDERPLEGTDKSVYWGHVEISSTGAESDHFVAVLDALYGTNLRPVAMQSHVMCQAVGLANDPGLAATHQTRMKLFFSPDHEEGYAEVYLNLDVPAGRVEFHEKDPGYRINVVRALTHHR